MAMEIKELIIQLIQQDMKHWQLVEYICKAGFKTDGHELEVYRIVAELMGVDYVSKRWLDVYWNCLGSAGNLPMGVNEHVFRGLAEECYMLLSGVGK